MDRTKQTHLAAYEHFLNGCCKISFCWYVKDSKLNWRDLTGPEKIRLFNSMDILTVFPSLPHKNEIQHLRSIIIHLINSLKGPDCDADDLQSEAKQWVRHFCSIYQTKHVTPYMHALAMHVYGSICKFNQQGLEKLNDTTTTHYLRGTNHRKTEALTQLLQKKEHN